MRVMSAARPFGNHGVHATAWPERTRRTPPVLTAAYPTAPRLGRLRLPPFLLGLTGERAGALPRRWPAWLPVPANRPDDDEGDALDTAAAADALDPPAEAVAAGWVTSSLDLKLGVDVIDLGPVEWFDVRDGSFG
jgi:hypothetical protein